MTLEEIVNSLKSAGQDYGQLFNNNPKYTAVASNVTKGLENLVPPQFTNTQDAKSQEYSKKLAEWALGNGMGMSGMALGTKIPNPIKDNLNADLLKKYLSTGKLSPKEMAQYEANGLAMETPQLQRYNVANAMANPERQAYKNNLDFNWAHGSPSPNIQELVPSDIGAMGPGVYATNYFPEADRYATENIGATVYPLAVNTSKSFNPKKTGNIYDILDADNDRMLGQRLKAMDKDSIIQTQPPARAYYKHLNGDNLDMVPDLPEREHYVTDYQDNVRSRFAAFDPLRKNSSSLLASGLLGALLFNNENKNSENK
jgi:hypothetical protein